MPRTLPLRFEPIRLAEIDDPYPVYAELRAAGAVCRGGPAQWVIPRHAEVTALLNDRRLAQFRFPEAFSNLPDSDLVRSLRAGPASTFTQRVMEGLDAPAHTAVRRAMGRSFQPLLAGMRDVVERVAGSIVDDALDSGSFDAMRDVAHPLTTRVLSAMFGLPEADWNEAAQHAVDLSTLFSLPTADGDRQVGHDAVTWLRELFGELLRARVARPSDDYVSRLAQAPDVAVLDREQVVDNIVFVYFAGFETTLGLLGNACDALLRFPAEQQRVRADRSLVPSAIEELLRFDAPIQLVGRRTTEDLEVAGRTIRKDRLVYLLLGSANHDETRFERPDRLDVARAPNPHVSFGSGVHHCFGALLARMEAAALLDRLIAATVELDRAGAATREPSVHLRRFRSVPMLARPA